MNKADELGKAVKRPAEKDNSVSPRDIKRVKPTLISSNISISTPKKNENIDEDSFTDGHDKNKNVKKDDERQIPSSTTSLMQNPVSESFAKLIAACR